MGKPINIQVKDNFVVFNLTNRCDPIKECLDITVDLDVYESHIENTTTWYIHQDKSRNFYVKNQKHVYLHYIVLPNPTKGSCSRLVVDHINDDGLDNRRCNLQLLERNKNAMKNFKYKGKNFKYKGFLVQHIKNRNSYRAKINGEYFTEHKCLDIVKSRIDEL